MNGRNEEKKKLGREHEKSISRKHHGNMLFGFYCEKNDIMEGTFLLFSELIDAIPTFFLHVLQLGPLPQITLKIINAQNNCRAVRMVFLGK